MLEALVHGMPLAGRQAAQYIFAGEGVQVFGAGAIVLGVHPMHSRSAARLRLIHALTVPKGAPSRTAISACVQPST
ncbi:hypothetical protein TUM20286_08850 [Pseudomonas tohonis]|uniref:Uncharacterized protein n=1 Tax=Pseudomonas tohonis TaxID=2725477 RepID=A0ABQ4VXL1_9PSED|nr:hypothetical protein TUM20286_08850 [Pseudomonas tohonis]